MIASTRKREYLGPTTQSKFIQRLAQDVATLNMQAVEDIRRIGLGANGRVAGKYQLTTVGAGQYFGAIASGLYATVRYMLTGGVKADDDSARSESQRHSTEPAQLFPVLAKVTNQLLVHRADALQGYRMIYAEDRMQLDGVVGRTYKLVSNADIYEQFGQSCELLSGNPQYVAGYLQGREMTAVHLSKTTAFRCGDVVFRHGAMVQNSETAGRAIRSACVLMDSVTKTWSSDRFYADTRVKHVRGAKLRDRMMQSADNLRTYQADLDNVEEDVYWAMSAPLVQDGSDAEMKTFASRFAARADRLGVSATAAKQILSSLRKPSAAPGRGGYLTRQVVPTVFDLYVACLEYAKAVNVQRSIPLRQLAFSLLFRK